MRSFTYTVTDANGIHARPAGMLAKLASTFQSKIQIDCPGGSADAMVGQVIDNCHVLKDVTVSSSSSAGGVVAFINGTKRKKRKY